MKKFMISISLVVLMVLSSLPNTMNVQAANLSQAEAVKSLASFVKRKGTMKDNFYSDKKQYRIQFDSPFLSSGEDVEIYRISNQKIQVRYYHKDENTKYYYNIYMNFDKGTKNSKAEVYVGNIKKTFSQLSIYATIKNIKTYSGKASGISIDKHEENDFSISRISDTKMKNLANNCIDQALKSVNWTLNLVQYKESQAVTLKDLGYKKYAGKMEMGYGRTLFTDSAKASANASTVPMNQLQNYASLKNGCSDAEFQAAYNIAKRIVKPLAGQSRESQVRTIVNSIRWMFDSGEVEYSMAVPHYNDPYGYFISGVGSCAGSTRATGLCLNILGIPYEHVHENMYCHQCCRVPVKNDYWVVDAYGLYLGKEPAPYKHPYKE